MRLKRRKAKWRVCIASLLLPGIGIGAGYPVESSPRTLTPLMEQELKGCFDFFWNEYIDEHEWPTYGMNAGDYVGMLKNIPIAIENQGFYFSAIVIGVERGWITRKAGEQRALDAMKSIRDLKHFDGFYYHLIDKETGLQGWHKKEIEVSNIATATMIAGAIVAGEYFGGEIKELAHELYARINWKSFLDTEANHFYLARHTDAVPEGKKVNKNGYFGHWGAYSEHLLMYILGAGAPNPEYATSAKPYYSMDCHWGSYKGETFIFCGSGSAFTYQWTHCFVDFRNIEDRRGINWFENSRHAAIAARQFAIDRGDEIRGLGKNSWGMTASMGASRFYNGHYGSLPAGYQGKTMDHLTMDGTVAPYGSSGFITFTPEASIEALEYMYSIPGLAGKYGLYDAYSFHTKSDGITPWIAETYLGIDKGIVALMFENYSTQMIWKLFHQNKHIQNGIRNLEFRSVH
jgi:hypothetical protein